MFGIGILELAVVLIVALLVLGPKHLPDTARMIGRWFYQMKATVDSAQREIEKEWNLQKEPDDTVEENHENRS